MTAKYHTEEEEEEEEEEKRRRRRKWRFKEEKLENCALLGYYAAGSGNFFTTPQRVLTQKSTFLSYFAAEV